MMKEEFNNTLCRDVQFTCYITWILVIIFFLLAIFFILGSKLNRRKIMIPSVWTAQAQQPLIHEIMTFNMRMSPKVSSFNKVSNNWEQTLLSRGESLNLKSKNFSTFKRILSFCIICYFSLVSVNSFENMRWFFSVARGLEKRATKSRFVCVYQNSETRLAKPCDIHALISYLPFHMLNFVLFRPLVRFSQSLEWRVCRNRLS